MSDIAAASIIVKELLGCEWGRGISLPGDFQPCPEKAVRLVQIHHDGTEADGIPIPWVVRLCQRHIEVVERETTPHAE